MAKSEKIQDNFLEVITANQGILHKVVAMYFDREEDRRDMFQEILMQLWRSFPTFRNESKISTWIYRVALNTAISFFRKEKRILNNTTSLPVNIPEEEKYYSEDYKTKMNFLYQAIDKLSKVEKAIILLYLEEKSYEEIAEIIGITVNNVGVKINRIKSRLKKILKPVSHELR